MDRSSTYKKTPNGICYHVLLAIFLCAWEQIPQWFSSLAMHKKSFSGFPVEKCAATAGDIQVEKSASKMRLLTSRLNIDALHCVSWKLLQEQHFKSRTKFQNKTLYVTQIKWKRTDWELKMAMDCWFAPSSKSRLFFDNEYSIVYNLMGTLLQKCYPHSRGMFLKTTFLHITTLSLQCGGNLCYTNYTTH